MARKRDFKLHNLSTLAGASLRVFLGALRQGRIAPRYYLNVLLTGLIVLVATPFRWYEYWLFRGRLRRFKMAEPPLFILGHWRSGTTFLHNVLCQDPRAGFLTTYQSLFPENLGSQWLFKSFMRAVMPEKRPSDNVKLSVDFPQEDEFAVGNMFPMAYYYFFYFPDQYARFYQEFARLQVRPARRRRWQNTYQRLLAKALLNTQRPRAVFKNPVNTVRLPILLEMYPEARFIYLYRNPIVVYLSTKKFFLSLFPTLQFQPTNEAQIVALILDVFAKMYRDYEADKAQLQPGRLLEISFEEFEKDPLGHLQMLYERLQLPDFEQARPFFEAYIRSQESYEKNRYQIKKTELEQIQIQWAEILEAWGYSLPSNLEVID